jgi:formate-dependent nitrite reductase complex subunit NrfG
MSTWWKAWPAWAAMAVIAVVALAVGVARDGGPSTQAERVDAIARTIKCPPCAGESVYESRHPTARAIRTDIARQVRAGQADDAVRADLAARFGDDIVLVPSTSGVEGLLWVLPVAAAVLASAGLAVAFARWRRIEATRDPTDEDRAIVARALADEAVDA